MASIEKLITAIIGLLMITFGGGCSTSVHARCEVVKVEQLTPVLRRVGDIKVLVPPSQFFTAVGLMMIDTPTLSPSFGTELSGLIEAAIREGGGSIYIAGAPELRVQVVECTLVWSGSFGITSRAFVRLVAETTEAGKSVSIDAQGEDVFHSVGVMLASSAEPQLGKALSRAVHNLLTAAPKLIAPAPSTDGSVDVATGSCFAIRPDGWLVTASHVVDDGGKLEVQFGGLSAPARVILRDGENDLALLKVDVPTPDFLGVSGDSQIEIGRKVYTLGYPAVGFLSQDIRFTEGSISAVRAFEGNETMFQVSVPVQPGNSGGPLIDEERGLVIGVVVAKASAQAFLRAVGTLPENVSFAVDSDQLRSLLRRAGIEPGETTSTSPTEAAKATHLLISR